MKKENYTFAPRLLRDESGAAIVKPDENGEYRYAYVTGELDSASTVDLRHAVIAETEVEYQSRVIMGRTVEVELAAKAQE